MNNSPCPFCGSKDIDIVKPAPTYIYLFCGFCGAQGPLATGLTIAIELWDQRVADAEK